MKEKPEDSDLLRLYARDRSETAFAELVGRHINLVYASALRRVGGDAHLAKDVTQQVFVALARAAETLADRPVLAGWLHTTTRNQAAQLVRTERRRQGREQEAWKMNDSVLTDPTAAADWARLRPAIDGALDELEDHEREAVLLRYFEGRSFAELGERLGLTENAARMRVDRALDRMHGFLSRRGVTSTVGALALALTGEATVAAPVGLAAIVTGAAVSGTVVTTAAAGGVTLLAFMNTTKIVAGIAVLAATVATGVAVRQVTANQRTQEELHLVRGERDTTRARLHEAEHALAAEKARTQEMEADTVALLGAIDRARTTIAAAQATPSGPVTKETVQARYTRAQELARAGNWEAALPELLWCYDEGMLRVDSFAGVRLSFLLSELGRLATKYPPALVALRERRDRAAKAMTATNDFQAAAEFAALNGALAENNRTLEVFDKLPAGDPLRQRLASPIFDQLVVARRYNDAAEVVPFGQMASRFARTTQRLPAAPAGQRGAEEMRTVILKGAVTTAAQNIEVLSGAGKLDEARELMKQVLAYDGSNETKLIIKEHLSRAGHPELMPPANP